MSKHVAIPGVYKYGPRKSSVMWNIFIWHSIPFKHVHHQKYCGSIQQNAENCIFYYLLEKIVVASYAAWKYYLVQSDNTAATKSYK